MSVLWLLVARGGSKGVPGKNLRKIGGLSLVGWKARAAQAAIVELARGEVKSRLIISTDSPAIQIEAARHGISAPFLRPAELATDDAKTVDVIRHALEYLHGVGEEYSTVILLEISAPFTTAADYLAAYRMYCERDAHLVVGMRRVEIHSSFVAEQLPDGDITPLIIKMYGYGADTRRQARGDDWTMNAALYIFRSEVVMSEKYDVYGVGPSIYNGSRNFGYLMDRWHSIEIDTPVDLEMAEYAVARGHVKMVAR